MVVERIQVELKEYFADDDCGLYCYCPKCGNPIYNEFGDYDCEDPDCDALLTLNEV